MKRLWKIVGPGARRVPLLLLVAAAITVTGCAPLVGVKRLSSRDVHRSLTGNALSTGDLSEATRVALRRNNLIDRFDEAPEAALAELHRSVLSEGYPNDDLFALAELSFFHAEHTRKRPYYLAAAVYSFAFLFPEDVKRAPLSTDPAVVGGRALSVSRSSGGRAARPDDRKEKVGLRSGLGNEIVRHAMA